MLKIQGESDTGSLEKFTQWAFFPTALIATPAAIYYLIDSGFSIPVATYAVLVILGLAFWIVELLMPYRKEWNKPQGDFSNDLISGTVAYILLPIFLKPLFIALLAGGTAWLAAKGGGSLWPSDWPVAVQLVLLLLLGDAGRY